MKCASAAPSGITIVTNEGDSLALEGALDIHTVGQVRKSLQRHLTHSKSHALDIAGVTALDTPGALFLCELHKKKNIKLMNIRPEHRALLDLIGNLELKSLPLLPTQPAWRQLIIRLGKGALEAWRDMLEIITFSGRAAVVTAGVLVHPHRLRLTSIAHHIEETGLYALPIVGLMAVMISVVIGYQGVAQLRPYGGEDFTINLIAVSVLREMAVLVTAILVAGRSGSAFTAEIGMMESRQEIDALEVMGFDPVELLVVPRLIGLVIALPLLTFFADMMGLLGGAAISNALLGVSLPQYFQRVHHIVGGNDLFVGMLKAPIFAFFIAIVGCMHGLKVSGSAESVGKETTAAVVKAIFLVLALDALFSILFEQLGI